MQQKICSCSLSCELWWYSVLCSSFKTSTWTWINLIITFYNHRSYAQIKCFSILNCMNSLYIWDINSFSDISFADVLFHSTDYLFVLFMVSFPVQVFRFCVLLLQTHFFLVRITETQNIYTLDFYSLPSTSIDLEPNILIYLIVHILREILTHICHLSHWLDFLQCLFCSLKLLI